MMRFELNSNSRTPSGPSSVRRRLPTSAAGGLIPQGPNFLFAAAARALTVSVACTPLALFAFWRRQESSAGSSVIRTRHPHAMPGLEEDADGSCIASRRMRRKTMLYTLAVILLILWLLGLVSGYTIGAFIHVLLVVAVVLFVVGLLSGRRVV
jgi:VIT1/CCC1 family predicted Fe2+/Mn2+ transporter